MALSPKEKRFVDEYLVDLNATRAAIAAGYSKKTASQQGYQILHKPLVAQAIEKAMETRARRVQITQDEVLKELALIAFSDVNDYAVSESGNVDVVAKAPENASRAVASVKRKVVRRGEGDEEQTTVETELKLWDKTAALRMAGQHLAMFKDVQHLTGEVTVKRIILEDGDSDGGDSGVSS